MFSNVGRPRREDHPNGGGGSKIKGSVQIIIVCDLETEASDGVNGVNREEILREFATMTFTPAALRALEKTGAVRSRFRTNVIVRHML